MRLRLTDAVIRRHQADVWRFLRLLGAAPSLAEDLTQEAFLAIESAAPEDRGDKATGSWLRSVARRLFLRHLRDARRGAPGGLRPGLETLDATVLERLWAERSGAECEAATTRAEALEHCLEELAPRAREALDLRYRDGLGREAMAQRMGLAPEGVKTLLRRTRGALERCVRMRIQGGAS